MRVNPFSYQILTALFCGITMYVGSAQEPRIFSVSDFDLKGPVKSCVVVTSYGQEEFNFDRQGRLIKTKTVHSNSDYDITYYKYLGDALLERRDEVYRDNVFDRTSSMAHIYSLDTLGGKKLTESIISYARVNMEQFEYFYKDSVTIDRIVRTDNSGVDETLIERDTVGNLASVRHILNDKPIKLEFRSLAPDTGNASLKTTTMTMYEGEAQHKFEIVKDSSGLTVKEVEWSLPLKSNKDPLKIQFKNQTEKIHEYDDRGFLVKTITSRGKARSEQEYVHQLDGSEYENWVKQIITPQNIYTTRKIAYYPKTSENE